MPEEYGFYNNTPFLKIYRKELYNDDGLISVYLDLTSKMAYCRGTIKCLDSDNHSRGGNPKVGSWFGTEKTVCQYLPDYADFILKKINGKPIEKWSKKSKLLKLLCDLGFVSIDVTTEKQRHTKPVDLYTIKIKDYVIIHKKASEKPFFFRQATSKNGFFFVKRSTIIELANYWSLLLDNESVKKYPRKERRSFLDEKDLPKRVQTAIINFSKKDNTKYAFSTFDAYYDLLFNTCYNDSTVKGSELGAIAAINSQPITTYTALADRWNWSKAKVSRFFKNMSDLCSAYHLDNNKGTVIYLNSFISVQSRNKEGTYVDDVLPASSDVVSLFASDVQKVKNSILKSITNAFTNSAKVVLKKLGIIPEYVQTFPDYVRTVQERSCLSSDFTGDSWFSQCSDEELDRYAQNNIPPMSGFDPFVANLYNPKKRKLINIFYDESNDYAYTASPCCST